MRVLARTLPVLALLGLLTAFAGAQPPGGAPGGGPPPSRSAFATDSFAAQRDSIVAELQKVIAGREEAPAESVFKDIQVLKGWPAGRVLRVMNMGFSRSLGVGCMHCHDARDWARDDKPQKQVAREMWRMTQAINTQHLARIANLQSKSATINCTTCHRGQTKPGDEVRGPGGR